MKPSKKSQLGFKYSRDVADLVDADEYRALLDSGRMNDEEATFLKQFLKEYYGRPSRSQLVIHDPEKYGKDLEAAARSRRRDLKANPQPDQSPMSKFVSRDRYYSPEDYRKCVGPSHSKNTRNIDA